jgi:hypothetical protein
VLGVDDPWVWGVYLLCISSTLICVVYGVLNWNNGDEVEDSELSEETAWVEQEEKMENEELGL